MSSESDKAVFVDSVEGVDTSNLFQSKKWAMITDQSSNGGVFSGSFMFNLNQVSNLNLWSDLSEAIITFPIKLQLKKDTTADLSTWTPNNVDIGIKNGFYSFIDSVQIVIGGTTIKTSQIYENVNCEFKVITEWDYNFLNKNGATLGVSPDEFYDKLQTTKDGADTSYVGAANAGTSVIVPSTGSGLVIDETMNPGYKRRCAYTNKTTTGCMGDILGNNQSLMGNPSMKITAATTTPDSDRLVTIFCLGVVRLKDLSDAIDKMPLTKNPKGMIYVYYNAASHSITYDKTDGSGDATKIKSKSATSIYGHSMPGEYGSVHGVVDGSNTSDHTLTFTAEISGVTDSVDTTVVPSQTNARMYIPYFTATPETDRILTQKKTIRYLERFNTSFFVEAGQAYSGVLTPGLQNVKRVNLYPYFAGVNTGANYLSCEPNPALSALWPSPNCTSPFAALRELQFTVGGVPIFQTPQNYNWEHFVSEIATLGRGGNRDDSQSSGLIDQYQWETIHRFYTCDIGRRLDSEDGSSKGVQVSLTNATTVRMWINADIWYEKEIVIDTAMGTVLTGGV